MRVRRAVVLASQELRAIRQAARVSGGRDGLASRARHHLDLDAVSAARVQRLEEQAGDLRAALAAQADSEAAQAAGREVLARHTQDVAAETTRLRARLDALEARADQDALLGQIPAVTAWVRQAAVTDSVLISVVMPTRNRCDRLRRAIDSVLAQEYQRWELVVVDDGSDDDTPALLADLAARDGRITVISTAQQGTCAARNVALRAASGEYVCYLDDDNLLDPLWTKAVVWAFGRHPDREVLYGARVLEDPGDLRGRTGELPVLHFSPYDRTRLEAANFIDIGVLAHRRDLAEAHFDESLVTLGDWDLVLRLTEHTEPLALPVVSGLYSTSAPNRLTDTDRPNVDAAVIKAKTRRRRRPLRVLAYNALFPLVPETYIGEEMKALTDNGAELAWCTDRWAASPVSVAEPLFTDLDQAVGAFDPDVLVLFWAPFADQKLAELSRVARPFALRVHSFDFDPATIERVQGHPHCVGVWAYPHHAARVTGAHPLVPLVTTWADFPEPAAERPVVLSASAGLPKKDWPTLVEAFATLADKGADCRIAVGITDQFEDEHTRVRTLIQQAGAAVKLSIDVPHDQVVALLARTSAVVYTNTGEGPFGMPRSIIEGMCAATSVVLPDQPEAPLVAGPHCRTYRTAGDIVRHVSEVLAGGPDVAAEQEFNRHFAYTHFADPVLATRFTSELADALSAWLDR